jgi:hypothetical protein
MNIDRLLTNMRAVLIGFTKNTHDTMKPAGHDEQSSYAHRANLRDSVCQNKSGPTMLVNSPLVMQSNQQAVDISVALIRLQQAD